MSEKILHAFGVITKRSMNGFYNTIHRQNKQTVTSQKIRTRTLT
jgi:hypothetical protein